MPEVPNIGELLAPQLSGIPADAVPAFLARLERSAAGRYRAWAQDFDPEPRQVLEACADREDEIADRVDRLFPVSAGDLEKIEAALPGALEIYDSIFTGMTTREQLLLQAAAELQGAAAWQGLAKRQTDPAISQALQACSALEEESSQAVRALLAAEA